MKKNLFVPHELKTIEVDVEKKIFRVNGEDFGKDCTEFSIQCDGPKSFHVEMRLDGALLFANYPREKEAEIFMGNNKIGRLEEALITFVERAVNERATCEEV